MQISEGEGGGGGANRSSQQLGFVIISERGRRRKRRWEDEKGNGKEEEEEEKRGVMALLHAAVSKSKREKNPPFLLPSVDTLTPLCQIARERRRRKKPDFPTKTQFAPPRYGVGERERDRGGWGLP